MTPFILQVSETFRSSVLELSNAFLGRLSWFRGGNTAAHAVQLLSGPISLARRECPTAACVCLPGHRVEKRRCVIN